MNTVEVLRLAEPSQADVLVGLCWFGAGCLLLPVRVRGLLQRRRKIILGEVNLVDVLLVF